MDKFKIWVELKPFKASIIFNSFDGKIQLTKEANMSFLAVILGQSTPFKIHKNSGNPSRFQILINVVNEMFRKGFDCLFKSGSYSIV
jgi:hypothetical protein